MLACPWGQAPGKMLCGQNQPNSAAHSHDFEAPREQTRQMVRFKLRTAVSTTNETASLRDNGDSFYADSHALADLPLLIMLTPQFPFSNFTPSYLYPVEEENQRICLSSLGQPAYLIMCLWFHADGHWAARVRKHRVTSQVPCENTQTRQGFP